MEHSFEVRTYFEDTDAGGIVYHANYLRFAERARTEFLHQLGMTHHKLVEQDIMIVVTRIEINYLKPAFLEDTLMIHTTVEKLGAATAVLNQSIEKESQEICGLKVYLAFISKSSMKPIRIDADLRQRLLVYKNN